MVLKDQDILEMCQARQQQALKAMEEKYGSYCYTVARNILGDHRDAEESVNDAYLAVWNAVPGALPKSLLPYLAKTTRNIALKRLERDQAQKRGDRYYVLLDELSEVLPSEESVEEKVAQKEIMEAINEFLRHKATQTERALFLRRYFWGDSLGELAVTFHSRESTLKSQLFRIRQRLRKYLEGRGLL